MNPNWNFLLGIGSMIGPEGTCIIAEQRIGDDTFSVGGSGFGSSEHVIERLSTYICNAGLINNAW